MQRRCRDEAIWDLLMPLLNDQKRFVVFEIFHGIWRGKSNMFRKNISWFVKKFCSLLPLFHFSRRFMERERKNEWAF